MQYKSVRSSSKAGFKVSVSLTAVSLGSLLFTSLGWAAMTVTPVGPTNVALTNVDSTGTAYYPTTSTNVDLGDDSVPRPVPTTTQANGSGTDALLFNVTATTASYTPPSGNGLSYSTYLMAFVQSTYNTANYYAVPFAYYNTAPGGGGAFASCQNNCALTSNSTNPSGSSYYFAAPFNPNSTVQVAIYPSDLCFLYAGAQLDNSTAGKICTGSVGTTGVYTPPAAGYVQELTIKFVVVLRPNNLYNFDPKNTTEAALNGSGSTQVSETSDSTTLNLSFQGEGGSITTSSCPPQATQQIYFPGDKSIYLNTNLFNGLFTSPSLTSGTGQARVAPFNSILITDEISNSNTRVDVNATSVTPAFGSSTVIARNIPIGSDNQLVTGFTNWTQDNQILYNLGIYFRDYAGFVATGGCPLDNVQAVEVQTFLKESKCFIATAAFRSMDAAPVTMLRQFRDQVLLRSIPGQSFVRWYYRWSPPAAEWLIDHPEFRYPVLLALVPVEIIAWLCLRPMIFAGLMGAGLLLLVAMRKRMGAGMRGESV
jgi:hypothetical protein